MTTTMTIRNRFGYVGLAAAAALALTLNVAPVHAQSYDDDAYTTSGVTVYAPRTVGRSEIGAPIEEVHASRVVHFDDLNLDTRYGAHVLRARIEHAADEACDQLDQDYPVDAGDNPPCRQTAVDRAEYRVQEMTGYTIW